MGRRLTRDQWIGVGVLILGLLTKVYANSGGGDGDELDASNLMIGGVMILIGCFLHSATNVVCEFFIRGDGVPPNWMCSACGLYSLLFWFVLYFCGFVVPFKEGGAWQYGSAGFPWSELAGGTPDPAPEGLDALPEPPAHETVRFHANAYLCVLYVESVQLVRANDNLPPLVCHWHVENCHKASQSFRFTDAKAGLDFVTCLSLAFQPGQDPIEASRPCSLSMTIEEEGSYVAVAFLDMKDLLRAPTEFYHQLVPLRTQAGIFAHATVHSTFQPRWARREMQPETCVLSETDEQVAYVARRVRWQQLWVRDGSELPTAPTRGAPPQVPARAPPRYFRVECPEKAALEGCYEKREDTSGKPMWAKEEMRLFFSDGMWRLSDKETDEDPPVLKSKASDPDCKLPDMVSEWELWDSDNWVETTAKIFIEPGTECYVCMNADRDHAFIPCGHRSVCGACGEAILRSNKRECPICRAPATNTLRIFD